MIADAVGILKNLPNYQSAIQPSFASLTTTQTTMKKVSYLSVLYAGGNGDGGTKGLWPHKSFL